jgi:hypothetical protein
MHNFALAIVVELLTYFKPTVADGASMRCKRLVGWKQFAWFTWVWKCWFHDDHHATRRQAIPAPIAKAST